MAHLTKEQENNFFMFGYEFATHYFQYSGLADVKKRWFEILNETSNDCKKYTDPVYMAIRQGEMTRLRELAMAFEGKTE